MDDTTDENAVTQNIKRDARFSALSLSKTIRGLAAWSVEADIAIQSSQSRRFVRAFEGAQADCGILVSKQIANSLPNDGTDRFFQLYEKYNSRPDPIFLPVDIKSFAYYATHRTKKDQTDTKNMGAGITLTLRQFQNCQALIIVSLANPQYPAFLPSCYFPDVKQDKALVQMRLGTIPISMNQANPLPPVLAPFVMHRDMLVQAYENLAAHANDPNVKLSNPFSGLEYTRSQKARLFPFEILGESSNSEIRLRHKIWTAFNTPSVTDIAREFRVQNPTHAPVTHDIRLDHISGMQIFLELKIGHAKIQNMASGGQRFLHYDRRLSYKDAIFTYKCQMDYLLTMVDENEGYLIMKEDIPRDWWHKDIKAERYLVHEYPSHSFLNSRRVLLNEPAQMISAFNRIMKGFQTPIADLPQKSAMTASDILAIAGPCPAALLKALDNVHRPTEPITGFEEEGGDEEVDDDAAAEVDLADMEDAYNEADVDELDPGSIDPVSASSAVGTKFATAVMEPRRVRMAGPEMVLDSQLFLPLLEECRRRGKGCVLDLGKHHPMGRIGMIDYEWSERDKYRFDKTGQPPCWIGMLANDVVMVTIHVVFTRWRDGYAPLEGIIENVRQYVDSHPCVVVCTPLAREIGHLTVQRWVVPSELMPKVHVGKVRGPNRRARLYLENQVDIERLTVAESDMYDTIYKFLSGDDTITIGVDNLQFNPGPYLKSVRDFKLSADFNFDRCCMGHLLRHRTA